MTIELPATPAEAHEAISALLRRVLRAESHAEARGIFAQMEALYAAAHERWPDDDFDLEAEAVEA